MSFNRYLYVAEEESMKKLLLVVLIVACMTGGGVANSEFPLYRDSRLWPFASDSIWNMPIGSGAEYVPAGIAEATKMGMTIDENIIISLTPIYENNALWETIEIKDPDTGVIAILGKDRCPGDMSKSALAIVPIPDDFVVDSLNWTGLTPNHAAAILLPDNKTIFQTQLFSRCIQSGPATSYFVYPKNGSVAKIIADVKAHQCWDRYAVMGNRPSISLI